MKLQRHAVNPVLLPDPHSSWECYNVFNPAVIYHNGLFHMYYRAQGLDWVSRIGYAVSEDGLRWNRLREPVLAPVDGRDSRGVEDPRVTALDGRFYMCYTAYGREFLGQGEPTHAGGGVTPMIAVSDNLISWQRLGAIVQGEDNKDHVLFPRRVNGRYAAFHRRWPHVWVAYSDDLVTWPAEAMAPIYGPRPDNGWDSKSVGSNGPPIETAEGWLAIYHGYDEEHVYRFGLCLLDLDDPTRVIARPETPIFEPQELWELRGDVPNVVFSCANPVVDGTVYVFYGGGDHVIGLATGRLEELLDFCLSAS
ncbi:MAG: glycosidase [Chloroflexi bacterium]|nr:glycosidase [Chloroflexota bacterium]MCI0578611.1 glycosidase [Chloroflexota bacterium]MCI0647370.1 glycosidase [Chloroflexota bacterium]MCI0727830.1 glycosidase [Chloroflexota bacterium]